MIDTIYIEDAIKDHPRVNEVLARFSKVETVSCKHYGEVFNRGSQNFRIQKSQPSLMLAEKNNRLVLPAPEGYGIGGQHNYYFSHMMNCIYDCRYCFLQGMYRSANYVLFVNYESIMQEIEKIAREHGEESVYFFSGYDCDSLALEPFSHFVKEFVPLFENLPNAYLELRTKSTQIRHLLERPVLNNVIVAYSLSPDNVVDALEHKTPSLQKRIDALLKLVNKGWQVGLRFDPLVHHGNYQQSYQQLFDQVFAVIPEKHIHSVSLGTFRMPENFFRKMTHLYPMEPLFAAGVELKEGMLSYRDSLEQEMIAWSTEQILKYIPQSKFFPCTYD